MAKLSLLGIDGSPRFQGNTEILLGLIIDKFKELDVNTEKVKLCKLSIGPCIECRKCLEMGICCLDDDITSDVLPKLINADIIIVASPVHFNNVTSYVKMLMDRTWSIRGKLKNKIGGAVVVGRGYGLEQALEAIRIWMLKHGMILGHPGLQAIGFEKGEVLQDKRALKDLEQFVKRIYELAMLIKR